MQGPQNLQPRNREAFCELLDERYLILFCVRFVMKRIFAVLFVLLFLLVGCVSKQQQVQEQLPPSIEPVVEIPPATEVLENVQEPSDEYTLHRNESVVVNGATVKVAEILNEPYLALLHVNGKTVRLYETGQHEIEGGVDIHFLKWNYQNSHTNPENTVTVQLDDLALNPDEYLFAKNEVKSFGARYVKMLEVSADGSIVALVTPSEQSEERIIKGKSAVIERIEITPILTFARDPSRPPYAIVRLRSV